MKRTELLALLTMKGTPYFTFNKTRCILKGAEREDSSGYCFNVRLVALDRSSKPFTVFVRTID